MKHGINGLLLLLICVVLISCGGTDSQPPAATVTASDAGTKAGTCSSYCASGAALGCSSPDPTCRVSCESIEADGPCYSQLAQQLRCGVAAEWSCDADGQPSPTPGACAGQAALEDCIAGAYAPCDSGTLIVSEFWCDGTADCGDGSDESAC